MLTRFRAALGALVIGGPAMVAGLAWAPAHADATDPSATPPTLQLKLPATQTVYGDGTRLQTDFGARLLALDAPLEIRVERAGYSVLPRAFQRIGGTDVALPEDLPVDLNGLHRFLKVTMTPAAGATPIVHHMTACIGETSERVDPDAIAVSPYPAICWYGPFAVGSLTGVPQGYAATVYDPWNAGNGIRGVAPGRYDVHISIGGDWARALHVPVADRSADSRVVVKNYPDSCPVATGARVAARGCRVTPRTSSGTVVQHAGPRPVASRAVSAADLPPGTPLPDLRALPPTGFAITGHGNFLAFSATVWNAGTSPMVVDGFRRDGQDVMDGYQYFFDSDGHQLPDYVKVGTFDWDARPTHQHWHFRQFAAYSLLPMGKTPQASGHAGDVGGVDSRKEGFCLANTDPVDLAGPGAAYHPDNTDLATACGDETSLSIREVLAAGWGDTYAQFRAGQAFDLRKLANGCYNVWVEGNPVTNAATGHRSLIESSTSNNRSHRMVCIGGTAGHRTIKRVGKVGIVDDSGLAGKGGGYAAYRIA